MLTGIELLAKVKELGEASRTELVHATGYVSPKKGGGERLLFSAFYDALLEARGITLGRGRGGDGKAGRRLSYATQVLFNGNLTVGRAYTALVGLKPGDAFHIQLGRRHIKLIPMDAPQGPAEVSSPDPVDQHDPEDQQEHQKPQRHQERKDHPDQPDHPSQPDRPGHPGHPDQQTRRKHREQGDGQGRGQVDGQGQGKAKPLPKPIAKAKPVAKAKPTAKTKPELKPMPRARAKQNQPSRQGTAGQPNPTPA